MATTSTVQIASIAKGLGIEPETQTLPNGKVATAVNWKPEHLPKVFEWCENKRKELGIGKNDVVTIDGSCPAWLLSTVSHGFHPSATSVKYPQGGPGAKLPISGTQRGESSGCAEGMTFTVKEEDEFTLVTTSLNANEVDADKLLASLVAPAVPAGKPVRITGRSLVAATAALAEAYAHFVPSVSCFQPGVGFVTCISHDANRRMGTVEA